MIFGIPESFDRDTEGDTVVMPPKLEISLFKPPDNGPELHDIEFLNQKFESMVKLQNNDVQRLISMETERIRKQREQEERIRLEKEKQAKLLQEQREKEQRERLEKEQQQKKLEQQEKLKKEAAEKRQLEEKRRKEAEEAQRQKTQQEEQDRIEKLKQDKLDAEKNRNVLIEKEFNNYKSKIKSIKTDIVDHVNANKDLKKQIGIVRRKINPKFGQLSNSISQLHMITNDIIDILNTIPPDVPHVLPFILNFISKAIISQAESEIVVQPNAALPLANLTSNLLIKFPQLNEYLMPRFVKKCPLIIGYSCAIDTEEGRLKMGWKRNKSTNKWEESDKYDERVSGICSLFSVLTRLNNPYYPISMSWTMLARIANTDLTLITNVHFFCIANWWESCGRFFLMTYRNQAFKLLVLLSGELSRNFKHLPAATRLIILGEEGISPNMKTLKEMER